MSSGQVVSNSSPLIALARIGELALLQGLFSAVVIPRAVKDEVFGSNEPPPWIHLMPLSVPPGIAFSATLGRGEREAIALSLEIAARRLILDDLPARRLATSLGLRVTGTAGVVLAAKRCGLVPEIKPLLDQLVVAEFRLSDQVRSALLKAAGED